jgi:glycosyltransferase involved in cell wall biosynthesis
MRTRVYDYLWCGLPIVSSPAPGTDELLIRHGAGRVVAEDFAAEIVVTLSDFASYDSMTEGARRFVLEHQWDRTLGPLREFCRNPRFEKTKDAFVSRPALAPRPPTILDRLKRRLRA